MASKLAVKKMPRPATSPTAGIFLLDDHPVVRRGLTELINQEKDMAVCGEAGDFQEALKGILDSRPDIALVDLSLPGTNGIELIKTLKVQCPALPILVHSMHEEALYAERALKAGAKGYVMKQEASENVVLALRQILAGGIYLSDDMKAKLIQKVASGRSETADSPMDLLSDRELEVFQWLGKGLRTAEIAKKLHRSVKTIESYRARIKEKLNLANGAQLVRHAIQWTQAHLK